MFLAVTKLIDDQFKDLILRLSYHKYTANPFMILITSVLIHLN